MFVYDFARNEIHEPEDGVHGVLSLYGMRVFWCGEASPKVAVDY